MQEKNKIDRNEAKIQFFETISKINKIPAKPEKEIGGGRDRNNHYQK